MRVKMVLEGCRAKFNGVAGRIGGLLSVSRAQRRIIDNLGETGAKVGFMDPVE